MKTDGFDFEYSSNIQHELKNICLFVIHVVSPKTIMISFLP
jgi:hypothetical protein